MRDALRGNQLALGPESNVLWKNGLLSALGRAYHGHHVHIHEKAAALVHAVVINHPFVDGNKHAAMDLVELFLERSGYKLQASDLELSEKLILVAEGKLDYEALKGRPIPRIESLVKGRLPRH